MSPGRTSVWTNSALFIDSFREMASDSFRNSKLRSCRTNSLMVVMRAGLIIRGCNRSLSSGKVRKGEKTKRGSIALTSFVAEPPAFGSASPNSGARVGLSAVADMGFSLLKWVLLEKNGTGQKQGIAK